MIAHRGASGDRPENTLAAFQLAVEQRADMIEIDLHLSRDDAIVVRHDSDLASLGLKRELRATDLAQIRSLDAGDGEKIPLLGEVLDRFGSEIAFNLEIKIGSDGAYPGLEAAVLRSVEDRGLLASMLFSSFCDDVLERLRALSSDARLAVLVSRRRPQGALERARAVGAEALNPHFGLAKADFVEAAHAEGLAVYPYTVDSPADMRRFLEAGVDGLFTNQPARLRDLLDASPPETGLV
ncbi:MAG: glycerophosphodiester phosphodiesterase [Deltaproteobacteria bacterium]|nr:glycerophosphodiester phosphodiesterase [Deltaproteobacteria bacterium]